MGISEVVSPVTRGGSKVSGNIPGSSPGATSNPSRAGGVRFDSVPPQPSHARVSLSSNAQEPAEVTIVGPSPED
jgi:hypothetical protein